MTDIARLILEADTTGLKAGEKALDDVGRASKRAAGEAGKSASDMSKGFAAVGTASTSAVKGADKLTNSLSQTTRAGMEAVAQNDKLAAAFLRADAAIEAFAADQAQASAEMARSKAMLDAGKISLAQYNAEVLRSKTGLSLLQQEYNEATRELIRLNNASAGVTSATGQQRMGLQQLGYQLGDVATMYSLGARPMQIFASQSGQIVQAVQLATAGTSKFAGYLGGAWGIALTVGAMALTPLIAKLFDVEDGAKKAKTALQEAMASLNSSLNQMSDVSSVLSEAAKQRVGALGEVARINREIAAIERRIGAAPAASQAAMANAYRSQIANLEQQRAAAEKSVQEAQATAREAMSAATIRNLQNEAEKRLEATEETKKSTAAVRTRTAAISEEAKALEQLYERLLGPERALARRNSEFDMLAKEIAKAEAAGASALPRLMELEKMLERLRGEGISSQRAEILALNTPDAGRSLIEGMSDGFKNVATDFAKDTAAALEAESRLRASFSNAFSDGMMAALDGNLAGFLRSFLGSVLSSAFRSIGDSLFGASGGGGGILGTVFGSLFGRANGGQVGSNRPYLVGERGPELFVPRAAGSIVSGERMATGGTVINVDARGANDPEAVRQQVEAGIREAAPYLVAAAESRTVRTLQRPRLAGMVR